MYSRRNKMERKLEFRTDDFVAFGVLKDAKYEWNIYYVGYGFSAQLKHCADFGTPPDKKWIMCCLRNLQTQLARDGIASMVGTVLIV